MPGASQWPSVSLEFLKVRPIGLCSGWWSTSFCLFGIANYLSLRRGLALTLWAFLLVWLSGCSFKTRRESESNVNRSGNAVVCSEPVWNFGMAEMSGTAKISHVFNLKNVSNSVVRVKDVIPNCGCIVSDGYPKEFMPGAVAEFPVTVDTVGSLGSFAKGVLIVFDTSPPTSIKLSIQGEVSANGTLYYVPSRINFGSVQQGELKRRTVRLSRFDGTGVKVVNVRSDNAAVRATVKPLDSANSVMEIEVVIDGDVATPGHFSAQIVGETDHEQFRRFEIPMEAVIVDQVSNVATFLYVARLGKGEYVERPLIRAGQTSPEIVGLTYEGPDSLDCKLTRLKSGPAARITRTASGTSGGRVAGRLLLELAGAPRPIVIPLHVVLDDGLSESLPEK